jgi:hypothetical protein
MKRFSNFTRLSFAATMLAGAVLATSPSRAATIDLGFALDASGSVDQSDFNAARLALSQALAQIPTSGADLYRVSVVSFSTTSTVAQTFVVNSGAQLALLQAAVAALPYTGGSTCISCATTNLTAGINGLGGFGDRSIINLVTDGVPNGGNENGASLRSQLVTAGWDGLSAEAIGTFNTTFLQALVFPGVAQIVNDVANLPDPFVQGFILTLDTFAAYNAAIDAKIANIVNAVPLPAALALFPFGAGLLGFMGWRRRKQVAIAAA